MGAPVGPESPVDLNVLRDWSEWRSASRSVDEAEPGAMVLIDGDLQPDWRIPAAWLAELLVRAAKRGVTLAGVTKHSSLARGGAPFVGQLELEAESTLGPRTCWWAPVARRRTEVGPGLLVVVARLDPDARFAFRVDMPADADAPHVLGQLSALADDAAFPGYPYPLSVADRLAACPGWARAEIWADLESALDRAGLTSRHQRAGLRRPAFFDGTGLNRHVRRALLWKQLPAVIVSRPTVMGQYFQLLHGQRAQVDGFGVGVHVGRGTHACDHSRHGRMGNAKPER